MSTNRSNRNFGVIPPLKTRIWDATKEAVSGLLKAALFLSIVGVITVALGMVIHWEHERRMIEINAQAKADIFVAKQSYLEKGNAFMQVCAAADAPPQACILAFGRGAP